MKKQFTMEDVPVLYEDKHIIVVVKPQNMPSQEDKSGDTDLFNLLKEYIRQKYDKQGNVFLGLVHVSTARREDSWFSPKTASARRVCPKQ